MQMSVVGVTTVTFNGGSQAVSCSVNGSSNTVQAQQNGTWNVNSTAVNVSSVTFNGTSQPVLISPSTKNVYTAVTTNFTPAALATDLVVITGSATKAIRVLYIYMDTVQTTIGVNQFFIAKRSSDDTGGTSAAVAVIPHDSVSPANTAVVRLYSVNPTALGTLVGGISIYRNKMQTPSSTGNPEYVWDFTHDGQTRGIVLHGASEVLAINNNGNAIASGLSCNIEIVFTEE